MALRFPLHIPFVEQLGLELHRFEGGHAEVRVDLNEAHLNSWDVANAKEPGHGPGLVSVEMKTSFLRPAEGRLVAEGRLLHRSTTMAFCEGSVFDADRQLCAHATGTFKVLRKLPTKGRAVREPRPA